MVSVHRNQKNNPIVLTEREEINKQKKKRQMGRHELWVSESEDSSIQKATDDRKTNLNVVDLRR